MSPASSSNRSPGTTAAALSTVRAPSRHSCTCWGSALIRAAMVRSAWYSCQNENRPFTSTTTQMATASWGVPASRAMPPATHSSRAIRCSSWSPSRSSIGRRCGGGRLLGPNRCRRRSASVWFRPWGVLPRARSAASVSSVQIGCAADRCIERTVAGGAFLLQFGRSESGPDVLFIGSKSTGTGPICHGALPRLSGSGE